MCTGGGFSTDRAAGPYHLNEFRSVYLTFHCDVLCVSSSFSRVVPIIVRLKNVGRIFRKLNGIMVVRIIGRIVK